MNRLHKNIQAIEKLKDEIGNEIFNDVYNQFEDFDNSVEALQTSIGNVFNDIKAKEVA